MTYIDQIEEYAKSNFSKEGQKEILLQVKKLRKMKFSYEGIYKALTYKTVQEGLDNGFGLLGMDSYQNQIRNYIRAEKAQIDGINVEDLSWDSLRKEESKNPETREFTGLKEDEKAAPVNLLSSALGGISNG